MDKTKTKNYCKLFIGTKQQQQRNYKYNIEIRKEMKQRFLRIRKFLNKCKKITKKYLGVIFEESVFFFN